jgi:hypothetical protein
VGGGKLRSGSTLPVPRSRAITVLAPHTLDQQDAASLIASGTRAIIACDLPTLIEESGPGTMGIPGALLPLLLAGPVLVIRLRGVTA